MKKIYIQLLLCVFMMCNYASGQISLTNGIYTQNFDSLAVSGTANALTLYGWSLNETGNGTRDNELYAADDGGSATGDMYSYGVGSSTERALGQLRSGTLIPVFGAYFINSTGAPITQITITYYGEQWRLGALTARPDRMDFQYSLNATSLTTGTWVDVNALDYSSSVTTGATGALVGNNNRTLITSTITGLNIPAGGTIFIRWNDTDPSGADDALAVDDFRLDFGGDGPDVTAPGISTLSPADNSNSVAASTPASITFTEAIQKGASGTITVKDASNNTTIQTIDITTAAVSVSGSTASFNLSLSPGTAYYVNVSAGAFEDLAGNDFAGISDNTTWNFTTSAVLNTLLNANFNTCSSSLTDGFTQVSTIGTVTWACTTFGRDANNPPSGSAPNGVQINGFENGTNVTNEDWLISPALNLTGTTYPLLSFWSRTKFNGLPLQLKISTDYPGTGDPRNYTWTDLNGRFPAQTSDVWTQSANINLSAFKQPSVYIAFVYYSSDEEGARWTLDDIRVDNSSVPPPASITASSTDIQFTYTAAGSALDKTFTLTANDITADVTLTTGGAFLLSKDGSAFSTSITYTVAEANNIPKTVYVRFAPTQNSRNYTNSISVTTTGASATIQLKGTSIDPAKTLEVVNWNVEWFGSTSMGPSNDAQQEQNVRTIMQNIGADLYALAEVVDETRLANVVNSMPGYNYVISNFGSHTNPNETNPSPLSEAQKLAFVYKTSVFSNISTTALLSAGINTAADISTTSYNNWSSGRYPFMMTADVTLDGITKTVRFVLVHAKANTSPTAASYTRRKNGSDELHNLLNSTYGSDNIIILGDFNDDVDATITDGITPPTTSWVAFTSDTTTNWRNPTYALSVAGKKSTVSYNDVIDHVFFSNEIGPQYIPGSATILTDVASLVTNYGSTTTDHYPVFTRYMFTAAGSLPVNLEYFSAQKQGQKVQLRWSTALEVNSREFVVERSANGRDFTALGRVAAAGNSAEPHTYSLVDDKPLSGANFYRLKMVDRDDKSTASRIIKVVFDKAVVVTFAPNPVKSTLVINVIEAREPVTIQLLDAQGKAIRQRVSPAGNNQPVVFDMVGVARGMYTLKMTTSQSVQTEKVVVQ